MLYIIKDVLNSQQLVIINKLLKDAQFVDGKLSAGQQAKEVKNNLELDRNSPLHNQLNNVVMNSLMQNKQFNDIALPLRVATPFYVRYTKGMNYGLHVDNPVMGPLGQQYRSDISTTIFLNDQEAYEGGELHIETPFGEQLVKLDAGDAVVYPSSSLHQVREVTSGQRVAAVIWTQSVVKSAEQRALLYQLSSSNDDLNAGATRADLSDSLSNIRANLVRMWGEV
ncbi:MAG: Fe2+-dependent dioxygenase [Thiotrichaceae bacterium]|nr:Fe2+-dependent dioxygenase [Thiotrichaceae bacterium]